MSHTMLWLLGGWGVFVVVVMLWIRVLLSGKTTRDDPPPTDPSERR